MKNIKTNYDHIYNILDDELKDYLMSHPNGEDEEFFVKHPLYFARVGLSNVSIEDQVSSVNEGFIIKSEMIEKSKKEGGWVYFVSWLVEKPHRFDYFLSIQDKLNDKEYWKTLGSIFTGTERQSKKQAEWILSFSSKRPEREKLMNDKDWDLFNQLPEKVEIWRGVNDEDYVDGLSWTTDKEQGVWFSQRFSGTPILCNGWIEKDKILMCSTYENLIVCDPYEVINPYYEYNPIC